MPKRSKKGQRGKSPNPKGCPKGAHHIGRPSTDIRKYTQNLCDKYQILERLVTIAYNQDPDNNPYPPDVQLKALIYLIDRGYGKPTQAVEHSGSVTLEQLVCGEEER